jgi:REP element-mobilizing transposase RayT
MMIFLLDGDQSNDILRIIICAAATRSYPFPPVAKRGVSAVFGKGGIWEHRIRDETDWFRLRDYIHLNPVKHEYVDRPEDWPWSSFHRHVRLGWLDAMWPGSSAIDTDIEVGE